jgi:predicted LPLAT superfamily acyltransferase
LAGAQVGASPAYRERERERTPQIYIIDAWTHICKDTDSGHDRLALERWMDDVVRAENAV